MKIIGLMSGTSLDGLDMLYCDINRSSNGTMQYEIIKSACIEYNQEWQKKLSSALLMDKIQLAELNEAYGKYIANQVNVFIETHNFKPTLIASHGHTVFHQPDLGITLQIGDGKIISRLTNITTIYDFRTKDVQMGGQGAPLVPIGDQLLFKDYDYCLNLGGFANISYEKNEKRVAFDIGPCNLLLNYFSNKLGHKYDNSGKLARSGKIIDELFKRWNSFDYFKKELPKSLGIEWLKAHYWKEDYNDYTIIDLLHTSVEHIAFQIGRIMRTEKDKKNTLFITGGGAFNEYLIERIRHWSHVNVIIPDDEMINNKEALIFALLAYLRFENSINVLASVTGASRDHSSGIIAFKI